MARATGIRSGLQRARVQAEEVLGIPPLLGSRSFDGWAHGMLRQNQALVVLFVMAFAVGLWPTDLLFQHDAALVQNLGIWRSIGLCTGVVLLAALAVFPRSRLVAQLAPALALLLMGASSAWLFSGFGGLGQPWFYPGYMMGLIIVPLPVGPRLRALLVLAQHGSFFSVFFGTHPEYLQTPTSAAPVIIFWVSALGTGFVGHLLYQTTRREFELRAELAERAHHLDELVAERTKELMVLSREQETSREQERSRLARELHDEMGQLLTGMRLELDLLRSQFEEGSQVELALERVDGLVDQALSETRWLVSQLRPRLLDELGLVAAIRFHIEGFTRRTALPVKLSLAGQLDELSPPAEAAVFRILQEALTNVARHADAREVKISLKADAPAVTLSVEDDGLGMPPSSRARRGFGMVSMGERAAAAGGQVEIEPVRGGGTRLRATVRQDAPGSRR